jgi:hypothetical protein
MERTKGQVGTRTYSRKIKEAVHLLFFKRHQLPGARGYELKAELGPEFPEVLEALDSFLKDLDLKVTRVFDEPELEYVEPTREQLGDARYYITLRGTMEPKTAKTSGWRIDDIAGLAVSVAYLISKQGRTPRTDVEKLLSEKLPGWRVDLNVDRYVREGYLGEDDKGNLFLDWRSRAEIDQKQLVALILGFGQQSQPMP